MEARGVYGLEHYGKRGDGYGAGGERNELQRQSLCDRRGCQRELRGSAAGILEFERRDCDWPDAVDDARRSADGGSGAGADAACPWGGKSRADVERDGPGL